IIRSSLLRVLMTRRPPSSTPFPYTTLFRSGVAVHALVVGGDVDVDDVAVGDDGVVGDAVADDLVQRGAQRLGVALVAQRAGVGRSEEHTSELQSRENLVCRLLLEKKKIKVS